MKVAEVPAAVYLWTVSGTWKAVAMLLLALWVPATMHCALETLPGFSFLQSCCGGDASPPPPTDCETDLCGAVESGFYKMEDNRTVVLGLVPLPALAAGEGIAQPPAECGSSLGPASAAPPELPRFWQFSYRTALPPRAPSPVA